MKKWIIEYYRRAYVVITRICMSLALYKKYPFLRVLDENSVSRLNYVKFEILGLTLPCNNALPDFYIDEEFQRTQLKNYSPDGRDWEYKFGIFELDDAFISLPYPMHRVRKYIIQKALGDNLKYLCEPRYLLGYLGTFISSRRRLDTAILLAMPSHNNFYHWMIETLPRIRMVEHDPKFHSVPIILPINRSPKFVTETIDLCGLSHRVQYLPNGAYSVKKLYIPTLCSPRGEPCKETVEWLNNRIIDNEPINDRKFNTKNFRRIFISRDDVGTRGVGNSDEVDILVGSLGFKKLKMTDYTIREQALIFSNADFIIGIHGAALANLAFARAGCKFIEIFMDGWFNCSFFNLARLRGIDYGYLLCEKEINSIHIDINKLRTLVNEIDTN